MVKSIITGGSGNRTAVPLPRDPATVEVVLLPENIVAVLETLIERPRGSQLPSVDCGLVLDRLLELATSSLTAVI